MTNAPSPLYRDRERVWGNTPALVLPPMTSIISDPPGNGRLETGADGPFRPSPSPTSPSRPGVSADLPSQIQTCEEASVARTGCSRRRLDGYSLREEESGEYSLLEGDRILNRAGAPDAFLFPIHGRGYIILVNNKRRIRSTCWKGGSLWGRDGEWLLERPRHMEEHFKDEHSPTGKLSQAGEESPKLSTSQLKTNWGKFPTVE